MSKRNFFVLLLFTACFVWAIANIAEAAKPFCGDGICKKNIENSCTCEDDCGEPPDIEESCSDGVDNDCDELIDCDDLVDCGGECGPAPICGDKVCNGDETCISCVADCGVCPPGPPELQPGYEQLSAHDGDAVRAVGFASDGAGGTWIVSGGEDAHLRYWTPELDVRGVQPLDHTIYDLDVDGSIVVTGEGGWNGHANSDTLRIYNAVGFLDGTQAPIGFVYCVAISPSPDNLWTVASGFYGDIVVYKTSDLELYATKATKKKRTKALAFSPVGSVLASTSTAGRIQLWSFQCSPLSCELDLLPVSLSHSGSWSFPIAFSPNIESEESGVIEIVSGTDGGIIKVWTIDLTKAKPVVSDLSVDSLAVYCLAWSPDGTKIVAGGNGDITVYDADTLEILFQNVNAHAGRVNDVAFSPDSSQIVSGGADGALKLWDLVAP